MKQEFKVTTALDQPGILERLVEKLAELPIQAGPRELRLPDELGVIESSSIETYVSGMITFENEKVNMPFVTSFLFTCVKLKEDIYTIGWSMSLS
jgi:hypothetical protein